jgi:hypothetical protein
MRMDSLPFENDSQLWEEAAERTRQEGAKLREQLDRERHEREKVEAEKEAIEAKAKLEKGVFKSTLPYTEPLAQEICERISCGELLIIICNDVTCRPCAAANSG